MKLLKLPIVLLILLSTALSAQVQLYVSPAGNDANAGTLTQPWQTVQHALDNALPGCTINLMGGTYYENAVASVSGTIGNPITLTNYNQQNAVINGGNSTGGPLLYIGGISHMIVNGIEFTNYSINDAQGILVDGICDNLKIQHNLFHNINFSSNPNDIPTANTNAQPLIIYGDNLTSITNLILADNEIFNCRTGFSEAMAVNGNVNGFTISGNIIHDNSNIGIDIIGHEGTCSNTTFDQARFGIVKWNKTWNNISPYATSAGIYVDGGSDCIIENNTTYGNGYGIEIGCEAINENANTINVRNNLVYENKVGGIVIGGYDYPANSGKVINSIVTGNSIIDNHFSSLGSGEIIVNYTESVTIKSNLVYCSTNDLLVSSDAFSQSPFFNFNLYFSATSLQFSFNGNTVTGLSAWQSVCGSEVNSIFADPVFVNTASHNYHLLANSPAIDNGDSLYQSGAGETDIDTMSRIQNGRIDIGADEFGTAVGISNNHIQENTFSSYEIIENELIIHFSQPQPKNTIVQLYDAKGQLIETKILYRGEITVGFATTKLSNGIYFANCEGSSFKIIK